MVNMIAETSTSEWAEAGFMSDNELADARDGAAEGPQGIYTLSVWSSDDHPSSVRFLSFRRAPGTATPGDLMIGKTARGFTVSCLLGDDDEEDAAGWMEMQTYDTARDAGLTCAELAFGVARCGIGHAIN